MGTRFRGRGQLFGLFLLPDVDQAPDFDVSLTIPSYNMF